jgi:uncharacterized protein YciI
MGFYVVLYDYSEDTSNDRDLVRRDHAAFLRDLYEQHVLILSGPFATGSGALLLIRGGSTSEIEGTLDRDPFRIAGLIARRTIHPFRLGFGLPDESDRIDVSTILG